MDNDEAVVPLMDFNFSEATKETYVNGGCWILANKLNSILSSGYRAIVIGQETYHVGVRFGDNLVIDIEGLWTEEQWESRWMNASSTNYPSVEDADEDAMELICNIEEFDEVYYSDASKNASHIIALLQKFN